MFLIFILSFTQWGRSATYCCPLGLGAFVLDYSGGRRNGEVVLHRAADKISSSTVVTPPETHLLINLYSKPVERISGLDPVDQKLLSLG